MFIFLPDNMFDVVAVSKIAPGDSYSFFFSGGFDLFFIAWIEVKGTRTFLRSDVEYYLLKQSGVLIGPRAIYS